jgi:hypothetical protein
LLSRSGVCQEKVHESLTSTFSMQHLVFAVNLGLDLKKKYKLNPKKYTIRGLKKAIGLKNGMF